MIDSLLVFVIPASEDDIALAILRLVEIEKAVVEGAGATGFAACLSGKLDYLKGKKLDVKIHVGLFELYFSLNAGGTVHVFIIIAWVTPSYADNVICNIAKRFYHALAMVVCTIMIV